jgi:arsenate reductase
VWYEARSSAGDVMEYVHTPSRPGAPQVLRLCVTRVYSSPQGKDQAMELTTTQVEDLLGRERVRLAEAFRGTFSQETIDRYMRGSLDRLKGARVTHYLPIFAYRLTHERLAALARANTPHVLFVCVHNAARSQMAAALTAHLGGGQVEVHSAGSDPAEQIDPAAVDAMRELGIDLSHEFPEPLTDELVRAADVVITMGCADACPSYPFKTYEDWAIDETTGHRLDPYQDWCIDYEDWSIADLAEYSGGGARTAQRLDPYQDSCIDYEDWSIADLAQHYTAATRSAHPLEQAREVRDAIRTRIEHLLVELAIARVR